MPITHSCVLSWERQISSIGWSRSKTSYPRACSFSTNGDLARFSVACPTPAMKKIYEEESEGWQKRQHMKAALTGDDGLLTWVCPARRREVY